MPIQLTPEEQVIQRRRAIAEAMMQQGMQPLESIGTAGGAPIPISHAQGLNKLAAGYLGQQDLKAADTQLSALEQQRKAEKEAAIQKVLASMQDQPAIASPADELGGGPGRPEIKRTPQELVQAALAAAASQYPEVQNIGNTMWKFREAEQTREDTQAANLVKAKEAAAAKAEAARIAEEGRNERAAESRRLQAVLLDRRLSAKESASTENETVDLGLPKPASTPWAGISDPKSKSAMQRATGLKDMKLLDKDEERVRGLEDAAIKAQRFMELNKAVDTGTLTDKLPGGQWATSFGEKNAEMQSITSEVAPRMRPEGSGASSDFDAKQFVRATQSVEKPKETNDSIGNAIIARAKREADYLEFRQQYYTQNKTLGDSQRHWKEYVSKNPIFDPAKPGTFELNPNRKSWQEWFSANIPSNEKSDTTEQSPSGLSPAGASAFEKYRKR